MLQSMRHLAHSWIVKGLMLFLIVSFSIWGIGDIFRGNPLQKSVASIGNSNISVQQLNHSFDEMLVQARQAFSPNLTAKQARQMGLLDKVLDNSIKHLLVEQDIKKLGISVGPSTVLAQLAALPQFRDKDGKFNKERFKDLLDRQRLTENGFISQSQQQLAQQVLMSSLQGSALAPAVATDVIYNARAQKRIFDIVTIDADKITGIGVPDDKTAHEFYDQHSALFLSPEYRGVTIASLSTDAIAKDIIITDDQVKKEYDSKHDQLAQPEKRDLVQVVVQDEDQAKQLAADAHAEHDLSNAAKAKKLTAVPLGAMDEKNLLPELSRPVFKLGKGDIAEPIKTQLGWHVIQVKEIVPAGIPSFDKIKDELRDSMRNDQAIETSTRDVNQIDDQLAAGHSLEDIADTLKLRLVRVQSIDAKGLMPDGKNPTELPNKEQVLKDLFAQNSGETSPVEDDKEGHYFVVRTDQVTPSGPKPFDSVKDQVIEAWKEQQQAEKAKAEAQGIAKALEADKPADSFAGKSEITIRKSLPLTELGDTDPAIPNTMMADVFRIRKGETATGTDAQKIVVIRLASIVPAESKDDPRRKTVEDDIRKTSADDLREEYLQHLYTQFPVKTNTGLLDSLREQDSQ